MAKASDLAERMRKTALNGKATERKVEPEPEMAPPPVTTAKAPPAVPTKAPSPRPAPLAQKAPNTAPPRRAASGRAVKTMTRYTIDLDQNQRRALKLFALNLDAGASEVIRSLISMLQESEDIRREVAERVEATRQNGTSG